MQFTGQDAIAVVAHLRRSGEDPSGPIGPTRSQTRIRGGVARRPTPRSPGEVDHLRGRLAEVEERLDFAERLLAQAREADQLPGGTHR